MATKPVSTAQLAFSVLDPRGIKGPEAQLDIGIMPAGTAYRVEIKGFRKGPYVDPRMCKTPEEAQQLAERFLGGKPLIWTAAESSYLPTDPHHLLEAIKERLDPNTPLGSTPPNQPSTSTSLPEETPSPEPTAPPAPSSSDEADAAPKTTFLHQQDAPSCQDCGSTMIRNGSCYKCLNCGSTSGCT